MGCHILADQFRNHAVFYCSTSDWAFGPVFTDHDGHDAEERAEAFLRWLRETDQWAHFEKEAIQSGRRDPRELTERGLQLAFQNWSTQEHDQWKREDEAEFADDEEVTDVGAAARQARVEAFSKQGLNVEHLQPKPTTDK